MNIPDFQLKLNFSKKGNGICLSYADLKSLIFLHEQSIMTQQQLYEFYSTMKKLDYRYFSNRITKLAKYKLINKKDYFLSQKYGFKLNLVHIGRKGLDILKMIGWVNEDETPRYVPKHHVDHHIAIKELVIQLAKEGMKKNKFIVSKDSNHYFFNSPNITSGSKSSFTIYDKSEFGQSDSIESLKTFFKPLITSCGMGEHIFSKDKTLYMVNPLKESLYVNVNNKKIVVPDAAYQLGSLYFHIEIDRGTEKIKKGGEDHLLNKTSVEGKIEKYIQLAKEHPNIHHCILFVCLDDSIPLRSDYGMKTKRIAYIKEEIIYTQDFLDTNNLTMYLFRLGRSPFLISQLLEREQAAIDFNSFFLSVNNDLKQNTEFFHFDIMISPFSVFANQYKEHLGTFDFHLSHVYLLSSRLPGKDLKYIILPVMMREGNIRDQDRLQYFTKRAARGELGRYTFIWAIYPTNEEMESDVLRSDLSYDHLYFTNLESIKGEHKKPKFYRGKERSVTTFE